VATEDYLKTIIKQARALKKSMGATSIPFLQRKFKLSYDAAKEVYEKI
jgi:hypothetical protein